MKQVTIVAPQGHVNLSSITGTYEILSRANAYWQKIGNESVMEIRIAGFVKEMKLDVGFFSINPISISEIKKTDLVIIPSVSYDESLLAKNEALIAWIREQYKNGSEIACMCSGA